MLYQTTPPFGSVFFSSIPRTFCTMLPRISTFAVLLGAARTLPSPCVTASRRCSAPTRPGAPIPPSPLCSRPFPSGLPTRQDPLSRRIAPDFGLTLSTPPRLLLHRAARRVWGSGVRREGEPGTSPPAPARVGCPAGCNVCTLTEKSRRATWTPSEDFRIPRQMQLMS